MGVTLEKCYGWVGEGVEGWLDGWMDGWTDTQTGR